MTYTYTYTYTYSNSANSFPSSYWDAERQAYIELPNLFENPDWKNINLGPPPGPNETAIELEALLELQNDTVERERRKPDIELEADQPASAWQRVLLFGAGSRPNTFLLFQAMTLVGKAVVMTYKQRYNRARPSQLEPKLRPLIAMPGHPSYASGHATQAYLTAHALSSVVPSHEIREQLFAIAEQVAVNREWAGLHYKSDTEAGIRLAAEIFPMVEDAYSETFNRAAEEWL